MQKDNIPRAILRKMSILPNGSSGVAEIARRNWQHLSASMAAKVEPNPYTRYDSD